MCRTSTIAAPITFATASTLSRGLLGFASTDYADEEAADVVSEIRFGYGIDIDTVSGPSFSLAGASAALAEELLARVEGRHLVGMVDLRTQIADDVSHLLFDPMHRSSEGADPHEYSRRHFAENLAETTASLGNPFAPWVRACDRFATTLDVDDIKPLYEGDRYREEAFEHAWAAVAANRGAIIDHVSAWRPADGLIDSAGEAATLDALHAHTTAWGRRRRLVSIVCAEGAFPISDKVGGTCRLARGPHAGYECRMPHDGHWAGWRQSGPVRIVPTDAGPAAQLARIIAAVGVAYASVQSDRNDWSGAQRLESHHYGPYELTATTRDDAQDDHSDLFFSRKQRDELRALAADTDAYPNQSLRLADGIAGRSLRDRRDRLLLRMLGIGLDPVRLCGLTLENLQLNDLDELYETVGAGAPGTSLLYGLDTGDGDDFWSLVHASARLDGPLFAAVQDGRAYGRQPLEVPDVEGIVAMRRAECADAKAKPVAESSPAS